MEIELVCPYNGVIEEVHVKIDDYVIFNQILGVVRVNDQFNMITSQYEGKIKNVFVEKGDLVMEGMVIAIVCE